MCDPPIAIALRDSHAFDGLGQDQCRKLRRIVGANTLRLVLAAARTLWFLKHIGGAATVNLCRYRPWYWQKCAPSQLNIVWACHEALHEAGVFPIPPATAHCCDRELRLFQSSHAAALPPVVR